MKKLLTILLTMVLCAGLLAACGGEAAPDAPVTIVGTWEYTGMDCAYVFNADGTGTYKFYGADMPFTYTDDGTSVSILYENNAAPNVMKYSIEGKTLSIEDSFGSIVTYERAD